MARAVQLVSLTTNLSGLVVTRYGHGVGPLKRIEVVEATPALFPAWPGQKAARRIWISSKASAQTTSRCALILGQGLGTFSAGAGDIAGRQAGPAKPRPAAPGKRNIEIAVSENILRSRARQLALAAAPRRGPCLPNRLRRSGG